MGGVATSFAENNPIPPAKFFWKKWTKFGNLSAIMRPTEPQGERAEMSKAIASQILRATLFLAALVVALAVGHSAQAQQEKTKTERLLDAELNPFTADENGWTHMHWAAAANDGEAIRRLLELGASVDPIALSDDSEFSADGQRRAALLGLKMGDWKNNGDTPLIVAAENGKGVAASVLIASGADVKGKLTHGGTPLHSATASNAADVARMLLENGADVNAKDDNGNTPLHWAAWNNRADATQLLLESGAEINAKNNTGETPMDFAIHKKHAEMKHFLRQNGGRCNKLC